MADRDQEASRDEGSRYRYMREMEEDRDERERRALRSAGQGDYGQPGSGRGELRDPGEHRLRGRPDPGREEDARPDHRGRGPRGYRRSDARIEEEVNDRLTDDRHVDASEIQVSVQGGEVTLTGNVGSRGERRHAEDLAEAVSGVTYVMNNLRVRQPGTTGATG